MAATPFPVSFGMGGGSLTTTGVQVTANGKKNYESITNLGPGLVWYTRDPNVGAAGVGSAVPGCLSLAVGATEVFNRGVEANLQKGGAFVPTAPIYAMSPTTAALTVEIG